MNNFKNLDYISELKVIVDNSDSKKLEKIINDHNCPDRTTTFSFDERIDFRGRVEPIIKDIPAETIKECLVKMEELAK